MVMIHLSLLLLSVLLICLGAGTRNPKGATHPLCKQAPFIQHSMSLYFSGRVMDGCRICCQGVNARIWWIHTHDRARKIPGHSTPARENGSKLDISTQSKKNRRLSNHRAEASCQGWALLSTASETQAEGRGEQNETPALWKLRQEDCSEFQASLGSRERRYLQKPDNQNNTRLRRDHA